MYKGKGKGKGEAVGCWEGKCEGRFLVGRKEKIKERQLVGGKGSMWKDFWWVGRKVFRSDRGWMGGRGVSERGGCCGRNELKDVGNRVGSEWNKRAGGTKEGEGKQGNGTGEQICQGMGKKQRKIVKACFNVQIKNLYSTVQYNC